MRDAGTSLISWICIQSVTCVYAMSVLRNRMRNAGSSAEEHRNIQRGKKGLRTRICILYYNIICAYK